jgi:hypothetical protein
VPFARDLHPEFGYVGSTPRLFRRVGLVLAFVIFGVIAGMSSVSVFVVQPAPEPDPMQAMALARPEPLPGARISAAQPVEGFSQKEDKARAIKVPCREAPSESLAGDCPRGRAAGKAHAAPAVNERPAIAAVPIGHRDDPAVLAPEPATAPAAAIPQPLEIAAAPADDAPAAQPATAAAPVVAPPKTRARQQVQRRARREYSASPGWYSHSGSSQAYRSGGWGSVW